MYDKPNRARPGTECAFALQTIIKSSNNLRLLDGLPHSEILGSKLILSSPRLIAEYHVLHRLLLPRHPPNALLALDLIQKKNDYLLLWPIASLLEADVLNASNANDLQRPNPHPLPSKDGQSSEPKVIHERQVG